MFLENLNTRWGSGHLYMAITEQTRRHAILHTLHYALLHCVILDPSPPGETLHPKQSQPRLLLALLRGHLGLLKAVLSHADRHIVHPDRTEAVVPGKMFQELKVQRVPAVLCLLGDTLLFLAPWDEHHKWQSSKQSVIWGTVSGGQRHHGVPMCWRRLT
jgi:hypothetical protein